MNIEQNKDLIRRQIEQVWNAHNLEKQREFVSDDLLADSMEHTQQFLTAFPDASVTIEDLIAEGDKVVARLHITATNTGSFAGQPPTGKKIQFTSFRIYRIAGGKVVETWAMQDRLGLMQQLGLVRSSGDYMEYRAKVKAQSHGNRLVSGSDAYRQSLGAWDSWFIRAVWSGIQPSPPRAKSCRLPISRSVEIHMGKYGICIIMISCNISQDLVYNSLNGWFIFNSC